MARGEGEIDGAAGGPVQSKEKDFIEFQTAKIFSLCERLGAQGRIAGAPSGLQSLDGQRMNALVVELERHVAAAAQTSVAKVEPPPTPEP